MEPFGGMRTFCGSADLKLSVVSFGGDAFSGLPCRSVVVNISMDSGLLFGPEAPIEFMSLESSTCLAITTRTCRKRL